MLDEMHIANVALIRDTLFQPSSGMTVITGETGSGKTALLNALNQFHARFFRKLTKQTITKNQFKGVLFDTPLFFHPFGKQEKRAFLTNF